MISVLHPHTLIIYTISQLVRSYQFVKPTDPQNYSSLYNGQYDIKCEMGKEELDALINQAS